MAQEIRKKHEEAAEIPAANIRITIINDTYDLQNIVIFQREYSGSGLFRTHFPHAWKVFRLRGRTKEITPKVSTRYPLEQGLAVVRWSNEADLLPYGDLAIAAPAHHKKRYRYYIDENGAQDIEKLPGENKDNSITCLNDSDDFVNIVLYKSNAPVVSQPEVAPGEEVRFLLTAKLYFMAAGNIRQGNIFKAKESGSHVAGVDITACKSVTAILRANPVDLSGSPFWDIKIE